jgi:hypothetical protein
MVEQRLAHEPLEERRLLSAVSFASTYAQDFQSISNTNVNPAAATNTAMLEVSSLAGGGTVSGWYIYGTGTTTRWGRTEGASATGSFFGMWDTSLPSNRALGSQGSGPNTGFFGIVLKNTSGNTIDAVSLSYDAVMNRNPSTTPNPYPMSYLVSSADVAVGSALGAGTFNNGAGSWNTTTLGFTTPSSGIGAPNGTQASISPLFKIATETGALTGLNWQNNRFLYIRWSETDDSGSDATAGVDNFSIAAIVNHAPTGLSLSDNSVAENQASGTTVGTLSTTDQDAADTFTYSLVSGTGSSGNSAFTIQGNALKTNTTFDFETQNSYSILVRTTDSGGLSFDQPFTIDVTNVNEAPTAANGALVTNEDTPATGLLSAADPEGQSLTYSVVDATAARGAVVITNSTTGAYNYTPDPNFSGPASFTFKANDGSLDSNVATISISVNPVNDAPVAHDVSITDAVEDTAYVGQLSAMDDDADGLSYSLVDPPQHGNVSISQATGQFSYHPAEDYHGSDSFTYKVNDGHVDSNAATVSLSIASVNDRPTSHDHSDLADEDTAIVFTLSDFPFSDPHDGPANNLVTVTLSAPTAGRIFYNGLPATFAANHTFTITATDIAGGKLSFVPDANANASPYATFQFQVTDDGGTNLGGAETSAPQTFTVNIAPVNDPPSATIASGPSGHTLEGVPVSFSSSVSDPDAGDTAGYDWSATKDGQPYDLAGVATTSPSFSFTPSDNGSYTVSLLVTDAQSATGSDTFTWTVDNQPPTLAVSGSSSVALGTSLTLTLSSNDPGNDTLAVWYVNWGDGSPLAIFGSGPRQTTSQDGSYSTTTQRTHIYSLVGQFSITARAVDEDNTSTDSDGDGVPDDAYVVAPFGVGVQAVNPTFTPPAIVSVPENTTDVLDLTQYVADDRTAADAIRFTITGGADAAKFAVVPKIGTSLPNQLRFISPPNFESPESFAGTNVYQVQIAATDTDGGTATSMIDVTVTNVPDVPTISVSKQSNVPTVPEGGVPNQGAVYTCTITNNSSSDADAVTVNSISDNVVGDLLASAQNQNGGNPIVLASGQSFMFSYVANVTAQNVGATFTSAVTVTATDIDNNTLSATAIATIGYTDVKPTVKIVKSAGAPSVPEGGVVSQSMIYTYHLTNASAASTDPLTITSILDSDGTPSYVSGDANNNDLLEASEDWVYVLAVAVPVGNAGQTHTNTANISAHDDEGTVASLDATSVSSSTISYTNVVPTVSITRSHAGTIHEGTSGQQITYHFTVTNTSPASTDPVTVTSLSDTALGDLLGTFQAAKGGSAEIVDGASVSFEVTYTAPAANAGTLINNTVTVNVHDDENDPASANASDSITYQDVTPSVSITKSHSGTLSEGTPGQQITYHFTVRNTSLASIDPVTVTSLSDTLLGNLLSAFQAANGGGAVVADGASVSFDVNYTAPAANAGTLINNTVTVNVHDDENDPASANASDLVAYEDVLPSASIDSISTPRKEGASITVTGSANDPATTDPITFRWNVYKNGNPLPYASGSGLGMTSFAFTSNDNGSYQIVLQVTDDETNSSSANRTISVANVAPVLSNVTITPSISEDASVTLQGDITDPGTLDDFTLVVNWEGAPQSYPLPAGTTHFSQTHQYQDDNTSGTPNDNYNVTVSVTDKDADGDSTSLITTVSNVNPVLDTLSIPPPASVNVPTNLTGAYHDVGSQDTHKLLIDWDGDNSYDETVDVSGGSFSVPHTYGASGVRTVHVQLVDDDTGSTTGSTSVTVINPNALQVTNFAFTKSGFDVTFNHSPTLADLNLYYGPDAAADLPDVALVGDHLGAVRGSLVWNAATSTMSFVATGGVLADDTYHVTLVSGQNGADPLSLGFHDSVGLLDGNGDFIDTQHPDNYTNSFTISTPAGTRVVSIHDFARGPGQHVDDTPATAGSRVAVSVDDANGVVSLDFEFHYDPALLMINPTTPASLASGLPGIWIITVNNSTPGVLKVTASGTSALSGTNKPVVLINADVPSSAPYESAQVLKLVNAKVNGDLTLTKGDSAVEKVVYLADADGSGAYGAADAALIQRVAVSLDTGFDAHKWTDPLIVGDITDAPNNPPSVDGFDAALVLQKALGITVSRIPDLPGSPLNFASSVDPTLSIASNIRLVGNTMTVGVSINVEPAAAGKIFGITFDVTYDSSVLQFDPPASANDMLGPYTPASSGWNAYVQPQSAGDQRIALLSYTNPAPVGSGTIINLPFQLLAGPTYGTVAITDVRINKNSDPNEGLISWTTVDGSVAYGFPRGDYDLNRQDTIADVSAGIKAVTNLSKYQSDNSLSPQHVTDIGDVDQNAYVDNKDIQSLLVLLANSQAQLSPAGNSSPAIATPSPAPAADVSTSAAATALALTVSDSPAFAPSAVVSNAASVATGDGIQDAPALSAASAVSAAPPSSRPAARSNATSPWSVGVFRASSSDADRDHSLLYVGGPAVASAHRSEASITAIDSFYEEWHGRASGSTLDGSNHADAACDQDAITDDYHEALSLELLPS